VTAQRKRTRLHRATVRALVGEYISRANLAVSDEKAEKARDYIAFLIARLHDMRERTSRVGVGYVDRGLAVLRDLAARLDADERARWHP
jgi:hypothetical protein